MEEGPAEEEEVRPCADHDDDGHRVLGAGDAEESQGHGHLVQAGLQLQLAWQRSLCHRNMTQGGLHK